MKYEIKTPLAIHELGQRPNQEDFIFPAKGKATESDRVFILCDGMGGHQSGEVASQTVCEEISKYIYQKTNPQVPFTDDMLFAAMKETYQVLNAKDKSDSSTKMGTTFVLLYFHAGGLMAAHIGDSRYYHIRPNTHEIIYRSKDHSRAAYQYEAGVISYEELKSQKNNVILRAIMPNQEEMEMPDIVHIKDIRPGDWFFMCSDGMLEKMDDEELLNIITNKDLSDEQKSEWLVTSTEENKDNHSAFLIHIAGVMNEIIDEEQPDDEQEARSKNRVFIKEQEFILSEEAGPSTTLVDKDNIEPTHKESPIIVSVEPAEQTYHARLHAVNKNKGVIYGAILAFVLIAIAIGAYLLLGGTKGKEDDKPSVIFKEYKSTPSTSVNENEIEGTVKREGYAEKEISAGNEDVQTIGSKKGHKKEGYIKTNPKENNRNINRKTIMDMENRQVGNTGNEKAPDSKENPSKKEALKDQLINGNDGKHEKPKEKKKQGDQNSNNGSKDDFNDFSTYQNI